LNLVPRTLLGRTASVLILALVATQITNLVAFRLYQTGPSALQLAVLATHHLKAVAAALDALPENQRDAYIERFRDNGVVHVERAVPGPPPGHPPRARALLLFESNLREQLGPATELYVAEGPPRVLWVKLVAGGAPYWVSFAGTRIERGVPWRWGIPIAASVATALLAALWLVRRINRPLRALASAAAAVARGEHPAILEETGPEEIASLSRSFNRMTAHLRESERDRILMLAGVSHDLRTPLARLRLGIEMSPSADTAMHDGMVQDIEDIDRIVGQFLDFARDGLDEPVQRVDLRELALQCCRRMERRSIEIVTRTDAVEAILGRPLALRRAVDNLLENAVRHGSPPIELRVEREADGGATICVADRGNGVPAEEKERLLRPFTRHDSARGEATGTGLGLAIVDRIARMHNGHVQIRNRPGGGLEARLYIGHSGSPTAPSA